MSTNQTTSHAHHHITPLKTYLMIGAILLVMTVVTVAVASIRFRAGEYPDRHADRRIQGDPGGVFLHAPLV